VGENPDVCPACGPDEAEEKPIKGFIPTRRWSAQSSKPHETMRMGFYYLKFLTAVFGLWF